MALDRRNRRCQLNGTHHTGTRGKKSNVRTGPRAAHDQSQSKFCTLPPEIRIQIYREVFGDLSLVYRRPYSNTWSSVAWAEMVEGTQNELPPLLRACHGIYLEIQSSWTRHVAFRFADPMTLLGVLWPLPQHKLLRIRTLEIDAEKLPLLTIDGCIHFNINACLKFLRHLRLDLLVIWERGLGHLPKAYEMYHLIDDLVKSGIGWKELRVICNQYCLGLGMRVSAKSSRNAQPSYWRAVLNARGDVDGSVDILQRKEAGGAYVSLDVETARMWDSWKLEELKSTPEDTELVWRRALYRSTMVVVRRGRNVDIADPVTVVLENRKQDIARWFPGKSWKEIKPAFRGWPY